MKGIYEPVTQLSAYQTLKAHLIRKEPVLVSGASDSAQNHLTAALTQERQVPLCVVIAANDVKAQMICEDMEYYYPGKAMYFPAKDPLFYSADLHGTAIVEDRIKVLSALRERTVSVLVLPVEALYDRLAPEELWTNHILYRKLGGRLDPLKTASRLVRMGYERVSQIEHTGQFALRGSILDIFPVGTDTGLRIELWDDEIDSIRVLDVETQRSMHRLAEFTVYPAQEMIPDPEKLPEVIEKIETETKLQAAQFQKAGLAEEEERIRAIQGRFAERLATERYSGLESYVTMLYPGYETASLMDYIPEESLIVMQEPARIREKVRVFEKELNNSIQGRLSKGYLLPSQADMFPTFAEIEEQLAPFGRVYICNLLAGNQSAFPVKDIVSFSSRSVQLQAVNDLALLDEIRSYNHLGYKTLLLAESSTRAERLLNQLMEAEISAYAYDGEGELRPGSIGVARGGLAHGFVYTDAKLAVIAQKELTGRKERSKKRRKRFKGGQQIQNFSELSVGDYVVHENHGVGIYNGIVQMTSDQKKRDYFKIVYKDGGVLYVPTTSLDLLQRYAGGDEVRPKLNKLGGTEWSRTQRKVKENVSKLAEDLVKLYAQREAGKGFVYSPDTVWQKEFEEMFPYEETGDQLAAIEDVKRDMEQGRIMDRLICGDVGFGKTEVALRAAFKAVQDGKQVAYLAPTTILAQQHYHTFTGRMRDFPVRVELLSRFQSRQQISQILKETRRGAVDIVIGTHRLLSQDVEFRDLGLLIVDEEQRFGVAHKEKIKSIKKDVDVLTLTATPIPRTLHMSLSGIRDMSILEEPPQERQPIQTFVMEADDELIREAIYREAGRNGQVFYLHNRVYDIDETAAKVQALVPEVRVGLAHGQMSERVLEDVMKQFIEGEIDVLVCTTIIETGMDISNVNTIIIENADAMGLAQLYQLRGRVGRSNRVAYAYFLYRKGKVLQEDAQKRLEAIGEFTEFGSGFKIAMQDLGIRGAGNLLGAEQHGNIGAVGYDMYCKLLDEAMASVRGEEPEEKIETQVTMNLDAYIPTTYIANESQKLEVYKKIAQIQNEEDYLDMMDELVDRYGEPPVSVRNLVMISYIKALSGRIGAETIELKDQGVLLSLDERTPLDPGKLMQYIQSHAKTVQMKMTGQKIQLFVSIEPLKKDTRRLDAIIRELTALQPLVKEKQHEA